MKITSSALSFTVIYEEAPEGGYLAFVPTLPGCHTQGETIEKAETNIKEAIELYLESLTSHGEEIPGEKRVLHGTVEIRYPLST